MPDGISDEFSKRAKQIQAKLGEKGKEPTPEAKAEAALELRGSKARSSTTMSLWSSGSKSQSDTGLPARPSRWSELRTYVKPKGWDETAERQAAVSEALKKLTSNASSFYR